MILSETFIMLSSSHGLSGAKSMAIRNDCFTIQCRGLSGESGEGESGAVEQHGEGGEAEERVEGCAVAGGDAPI